MNMNIQKTIIKILSKCLLWVVIAAAGFVYLPHVFGLAGAVKYAQGAEKKADAPWYNLLTELPKGQKSFFSMAKTLNLSAWRFSGNYWNYGTDINNTKSIPADRTNDRDILLKALLHEWEFRVALPKEVADELGAGYSVEIAAKGDWGLNESELFFLKDPASFQYKLEDKYLYIKAYPQIRIRDDVFFNKLITNYDIRVPLVEPRYGVNTFAMFDFNGTDLGSASGYMKIDRPSMSQLQEELEYCAENKWIHPTQIINATGVLQGYYNENQMFDIAIWKNDKESIRNSHEVKIGNNTFAPGGAIGLSFWYPLKLSFYLEKNEDVAVTNITYTPLIPHSQATVTVTVANYGMSAQLPKLSFVVDGVSAKKTVNIVPALQPHEIRELNFDFFTPEEGMLVITAEINPLRSDNTRDFNEVTYDNNIYSVIAPINMPEFGNLPPWVLSKKLIFTTSPPAVAELKLPAACWWAGSAEGTLKVYNITPDLYHDFKARDLHLDAVGLNTVSIAIKRPSASFSEYIKINTKLCREDFGDDPAGILGQPFWAENYDLLKTGIIDTGGSVQRRYGYKWYCGGCSGVDDEICNGHVDYAYAEADFDPIDCRTVYIANVYNGMDELTYQKPVHKPIDEGGKAFAVDAMNIFVKKYGKRSLSNGNSADKLDIYWEGTHYPFKVIRYMCHLDENNVEYGWEAVEGQYERTFVGQSSAFITWETIHTMESIYEKDREAAALDKHLSGMGHYLNAVFSTDKLLQQYAWPIKSGYYFNPVGEYKCTVHTLQYKNTEDYTLEHEELVEKIIQSFCYDSGLEYARKDKASSKLGEIKYGADGNGLLIIEPAEIENRDTLKKTTRLATTKTRAEEANENETVDKLYREVMEGYVESATEQEYKNYKYQERTDYSISGQDIYLVEETTQILFKLEVPQGKMYTHVNMKNGEYAVLAKTKKITLDFDKYSESNAETEGNGLLETPAFNIDGIKITVSGSMYDDR